MPQLDKDGAFIRVPFTNEGLQARIAESVAWAWNTSSARHSAKLPMDL